MDIAMFKLANGLTPFGHDDASTYLTQAYGLLSVLNAAWDDATKVEHHQEILGSSCELLSLTSPIMGSALDGIAALVALGAFCAEREGR